MKIMCPHGNRGYMKRQTCPAHSGCAPDSSVTVHLHKESEKIRIKRGVRQGDTISYRAVHGNIGEHFIVQSICGMT